MSTEQLGKDSSFCSVSLPPAKLTPSITALRSGTLFPVERTRRFWSLEEYVFSLFDKNQTRSPEFEYLLAYYGREKLVHFWEKYQAQKLGRVKAEATACKGNP